MPGLDGRTPELERFELDAVSSVMSKLLRGTKNDMMDCY